MANIKTTEREWAKAREYFEAGLSLAMIMERTGISRSSLCKKSNKDGWSKETNKPQLIQTAIDLKLTKATMSDFAVSVHDELVEERTRHIQFITNATYKNISLMMEKVSEGCTLMDHKIVQSTIKDGRESLLGREAPAPATTAIQINNNQSIERIELIPLE